MVDITKALEQIHNERKKIDEESLLLSSCLSILPTIGKINKGEWIYVAREDGFNFDKSKMTQVANFGKMLDKITVDRRGIYLDLERDNFVLWYVPGSTYDIENNIKSGNMRGIIYKFLESNNFLIETNRHGTIHYLPKHKLDVGEKDVEKKLSEYAISLPNFLEDFKQKYSGSK